MKTKLFLSFMASFAVSLALFACSGEQPDLGGEPSSNSTGQQQDERVFCKLTSGACSQISLSTCMEFVEAGTARIVSGCDDGGNGGSSSSVPVPSSSSSGGSSSSLVVPETFLGVGYNVIESAYINPNDAIKHRNYPVLDQRKMFQEGLIPNKPSGTSQENFETVAGSSVKEVINNRSKNIGASVDVNIPILPYFSGGISGSFENNENTKMSTNILFAKLNYYRYTEDYKINGATKEKLKDYLTDDFKNALETKDASEILNLYGTHIFVQYFKGGSLEANYTYTGTEINSTEDVRRAAAVSYRGIPGVNVSGDISSSMSTTNFEKEENLAFRYQAFGGNAIASASLTDLKAGFKNWANSISGKTEICGIANFNSLMPIWDLASAAGYSIKANTLKTKFNELVSQRGSKLLLTTKYKIDYYHSDKISMTPSYTLKPPTGATIAEIEIYAIGAGGGGQGGNNNVGFSDSDNGIGGAGGGGAAIYAKLSKLGLEKGGQIPLNIAVGTGGSNGTYIQLDKWGYTNTAGCDGKNGGNTTVTWTAKGITLTANGGNGGNGNSTCKEGGGTGTNGGAARAANCPSTNAYIAQGDCAVGNGQAGTSGNVSDPDLRSAGGNAGRITKGSINPFGGCPGAAGIAGNDCYSGGERQANTNTVRPAASGSGGVGGFVYGSYIRSGYVGGSGLVSIAVKSYTEE